MPSSFMDTVRSRVAAMDDEPKEERFHITVGDVLHGALGAAFGAGVAKGVGGMLGVSPRFADKLETAAMAVGAGLNTGVIKMSEEQEIERLREAAPKMEQQRKHAFRLGFIKAAHDAGAFQSEEQKKVAALLPIPSLVVNPVGLLSIPRGVARGISSGAGIAGSLLGTADAPDEDEQEITSLRVQKELMEEQLQKLKADRRNRELRKVLAKRVQQR